MNSGGGGGGAEGRTRDGDGAMSGKTGAETSLIAATKTTTSQTCRGRVQPGHNQSHYQVSSNGSWGEYRARRAVQE